MAVFQLSVWHRAILARQFKMSYYGCAVYEWLQWLRKHLMKGHMVQDRRINKRGIHIWVKNAVNCFNCVIQDY